MEDRRFVIPLLVTFIVTVVYTYIRYHLFQEISWYLFPLYTINKIAAVMALMSLGMALWYGRNKTTKNLAHHYGEISLLAIAIHLVFSGLMMSVKGSGRITIAEFPLPMMASLSIFLGILAFMGFVWMAQKGLAFVRQNIFQAGVWTLILSWLHVVILGASTWSITDSWPYMMPPITLLSSFMGIVFIIKVVKHQ